MNLDNYLSVHANALRLRSQRTSLIASNIANSDTPNYKAVDLAFAEVMKDVNPSGIRLNPNNNTHWNLRTTNSRHLRSNTDIANLSANRIMYRNPDTASIDGNTVDKDQEQARFAENTVRYQASLEFMKSRVNGLIKALRGE